MCPSVCATAAAVAYRALPVALEKCCHCWARVTLVPLALTMAADLRIGRAGVRGAGCRRGGGQRGGLLGSATAE